MLPTLRFEPCYSSISIEWWATKTRYPPYILNPVIPQFLLNGGQQKHVTGPLRFEPCYSSISQFLLNGGQQKHVTHPTF